MGCSNLQPDNFTVNLLVYACVEITHTHTHIHMYVCMYACIYNLRLQAYVCLCLAEGQSNHSNSQVTFSAAKAIYLLTNKTVRLLKQ